MTFLLLFFASLQDIEKPGRNKSTLCILMPTGRRPLPRFCFRCSPLHSLHHDQLVLNSGMLSLALPYCPSPRQIDSAKDTLLAAVPPPPLQRGCVLAKSSVSKTTIRHFDFPLPFGSISYLKTGCRIVAHVQATRASMPLDSRTMQPLLSNRVAIDDVQARPDGRVRAST